MNENLESKLNHDIELITKMLEMQKELDRDILDAHKMQYSDISMNQYERALLDEIGELNHELKASWCWWKKTQKPIDNDKVLEELVDVWHFVLSLFNKEFEKYKSVIRIEEYLKNVFSKVDNSYGYVEDYTISYICTLIITSGVDYKLIYLKHLSRILGFTIDDIYKMYIEKNRINHERVEKGY